MELSLSEVSEATGARLPARTAAALEQQVFEGWSIDTRTLAQGDLFFAIKGEQFDGHAFLSTAFAAGAAAAVVSEDVSLSAKTLLRVNDTVKALGELARFAREKWRKPLVGITGSAGKTSTKDVVAALLETRFRVGKTIGNLNNHIGLPLTLLRIPSQSDVAVVEMGMNHAGEIRELTRIAQPQIGLVTNVGYAHIEAFESIEGVANAKRELVDGLPADGVAVLNQDDGRVCQFGERFPGRVLTYGFAAGADFRGEILQMGPHGSRFSVGAENFHTSLVGKHAISNVLAGIAVASVFGIPPGELVQAVAGLAPGKMRGARRTVAGATIIDDSYNSNPEAAKSMLDVLRAERAQRRIAVLGEMRELGAWSAELHRQLGQYAAGSGVDALIAVGGNARLIAEAAQEAGMAADTTLYFEDAAAAGDFLRRFVQPGDVILFKGSRGVHVERALARMEE